MSSWADNQFRTSSDDFKEIEACLINSECIVIHSHIRSQQLSEGQKEIRTWEA